jgi:PAS domain S-box-containing protein
MINEKLAMSLANVEREARTPELRLLYETAPIGLAFLTPDCRYLQINRHLCEICGISVDDHIGRSVRDMVPQVAEQVENIVQTILRTGNSITGIEVNGQRVDGGNTDRTWITNWYPLKGTDGGILGINVAAEEITERKRVETALAASEAKFRELADNMRSLNDTLEERVQVEARERVRIWNASRRELAEISRHTSLGAMAASIAHEVSGPLGALILNADAGLELLAKAKPDLDEVCAALKQIVDDGQRASAVISGIRSMFQKDDGKRGPVNVNDLIGEVIAVVRGELDGHRVSIQSELSDRLPTIMAEKTQLLQVLLNLVMNAIDAMSSVTNRERVLIVKSEIPDPGYILITVEDSGHGIDANHVDRIFEAFFTTKALGMGMGLSICRSIIESHGGLLWVSARKPYGSIFHAKLPTTEPGDALAKSPETIGHSLG